MTFPPVTTWERVALVLVTLAGALAGLLEALLVPVYVGATIVPLAVLLAVVSNVALPRLARALVPRTAAAVAPFVAWLIVMIGFGAIGRPEGDVILPGAPGGVAAVTYGLLIVGTLAGTATVVWLAPPPQSRPQSGKQPPVSR
ncbi:MAG TPA: hypothetical protein VKB75_16430 [Jatrophihabitans sp.]|nr:hypothetical protein [Jatrophihabitans sp.]